ncbi:hypothetical protein HK104_002581 [Borealophlyctis nickersoniae]|nr:hypothetical protein HK104_002581 [Borealophlyctis nickersoniae]
MSRGGFSLQSIKGSIFVQGQGRESALKKLKEAPFTPAQMLEQLVHIYDLGEKALGEIKEMKNNIAHRLEKEDFGPRNDMLNSSDLERFISNTRVFTWFTHTHDRLGLRMEAGLEERNNPQDAEDRRIRDLEERLLARLSNQQNEPKRITYKRTKETPPRVQNEPKRITYKRTKETPPRKKQRVVEPESEPEELLDESGDELDDSCGSEFLLDDGLGDSDTDTELVEKVAVGKDSGDKVVVEGKGKEPGDKVAVEGKCKEPIEEAGEKVQKKPVEKKGKKSVTKV